MNPQTKLSIHTKLVNPTQLLIYGFVRGMEDEIQFYVPDSIYILCVKFYHFNHFVIYLSQDLLLNSNRLYLADLEHHTAHPHCSGSNANPYQRRAPCIMLDVDVAESNTPTQRVHMRKWCMYDAGLSYATNVSLPPQTHSRISKLGYYGSSESTIRNNYHVVFRAGGFNNKTYTEYSDCYALALNTMERNGVTDHLSHKPIKWFNFDMPSLPEKVYGNTLLYSSTHQTLYSIAGDLKRSFYSLSLKVKSTQDAEWCWEAMPEMSGQRYAPSCCLITDPSSLSHKLFVVAGRSRRYGDVPWPDSPAEIFDFETKQWSPLAGKDAFPLPNLYRAGICYDEGTRRVYVAGGQTHRASEYTFMYDLHKMEWYTLPCTRLGHNFTPIVWKDNNDVLFIASTSANHTEWLDLRQAAQIQMGVAAKQKWNGFLNSNGDLIEAKTYAQGAELSAALGTRFPKDCCIARLLSANVT